ncbi:MAG: tetratricopeptide repeat protein [Deltaproteobacteria bacterium]
MAAQMEKDEQLEPLAAQFVLLKIDTGTDLWPKWRDRYELDGTGEPKVYVVRADGKQLYGEVGAPNDMERFLKGQLEDAGKILDSKELAEVEKAAKNAQKAVRRKAWAEAIEIISREPGKGSYAAAVTTLESLAGEIADRAALALKDARKKLDSKDKAFDGALALVEAVRQFSGLPAAREVLEPAISRFRDASETAGLIAQAEIFDKARQLEAQRKWREALAAYQELPAKHPDSPGAAQAAKHITDLEKRISVASGSGKAARKQAAEGEAPGGDEARAQSYLKLARQFEKNNPAKAREYAEKAMKAAPGSAAAKDAEKFIKGLPGSGGK